MKAFWEAIKDFIKNVPTGLLLVVLFFWLVGMLGIWVPAIVPYSNTIIMAFMVIVVTRLLVVRR